MSPNPSAAPITPCLPAISGSPDTLAILRAVTEAPRRSCMCCFADVKKIASKESSETIGVHPVCGRQVR